MSENKQIGRYEILYEIDSGAMGTVYRGRDEDLDRTVAIKMLSQNAFTNIDHQLRFIQEAKIVAKLDHPNIMKIYGIEYTDTNTYLIMEFLEGKPLDAILLEQEKLPKEKVLSYLQQLGSALSHSHSKGVVHLDIKPSNVMILEDGSVKLMDFGIAHDEDSDMGLPSAEDQLMGTPKYMSPEQFDRNNVDYRSDIYSLAIMAYEMVAGYPPFEADDRETYGELHQEEKIDDIDDVFKSFPKEIKKFIKQSLEKKKEKRPLTLEFLAGYKDNKSTQSLPAKQSSNLNKVLIGVLGTLILLVGLALFLIFKSPGQKIASEKNDKKKLLPKISKTSTLNTDGKNSGSRLGNQHFPDIPGVKNNPSTQPKDRKLVIPKFRSQQLPKIKSKKSKKISTNSIEPTKSVNYPYMENTELNFRIKESRLSNELSILSKTNIDVSIQKKVLQKLLWKPYSDLVSLLPFLRCQNTKLVENLAYVFGLRNIQGAIWEIQKRLRAEKDRELMSNLFKSLSFFRYNIAREFLNDSFLKLRTEKLLRSIINGLHERGSNNVIEKAKVIYEKTANKKFKREIAVFLSSMGLEIGLDQAKQDLTSGNVQFQELALQIIRYNQNPKDLEFILNLRSKMYKKIALLESWLKAKIILETVHLSGREQFDAMESGCQRNKSVLAWIALYVALQDHPDSNKWLHEFKKRYDLKEYRDYIRAYWYQGLNSKKYR